MTSSSTALEPAARPRSWIVGVVVLAVLAACGSDGDDAPNARASDTSTSTDASGAPADDSAVGSDDRAAQLPPPDCSVFTAADVTEIFGFEVEEGEEDVLDAATICSRSWDNEGNTAVVTLEIDTGNLLDSRPPLVAPEEIDGPWDRGEYGKRTDLTGQPLTLRFEKGGTLVALEAGGVFFQNPCCTHGLAKAELTEAATQLASSLP